MLQHPLKYIGYIVQSQKKQELYYKKTFWQLAVTLLPPLSEPLLQVLLPEFLSGLRHNT